MTNARTEGTSPPMVPLLDPLQLLLVDHKYGYREAWTGMPPLEDVDSGESNLHTPPSSL